MGNTAATPLISIIMPALNSQRFIAESIKTAQQQTFTNWELLIVDNGSSDKTKQIAEKAALADPRIRVFEDRSAGSPAVARKCALQNARGEWIAFLDSDDLWDPEKLQIQLDTAKEKESPFLFTASAFVDADGNRKGYVLKVPERIAYPEILKQDIISCSSVLVRRELLSGCFNETDNTVSDDFAAWIRILRTKKICAVGINQPLLHYRLSSNSLSANKVYSALRTFKTYRHSGLSVLTSVRYWIYYVFRSLRKYSKLYAS